MMDYTRLAKEWLRNYDDLYDPQVNDLAALLSEAVAQTWEGAMIAVANAKIKHHLSPAENADVAMDALLDEFGKYRARATEEQS